MGHPSGYTPGYGFSRWQEANPSRPLPAMNVDTELASIAGVTADHAAAIRDIRRSDGQLKNNIVGYDALSPAVRAMLGEDLTVPTFRNATCQDVDDLRGLIPSDYASGAYVLLSDRIATYVWVADRDFTALIDDAVDPPPYVAANTIDPADGAWVLVDIVPINLNDAVVFKYDDFRQRYATDQDALEALIRCAFAYSRTIDFVSVIDLSGRTVQMTRPIDVGELVDQSNNSSLMTFCNGGLRAMPSSDWEVENFAKVITWTKNSDLITMADTAGLEPGMHLASGEIMGAGICRYSWITEIVDDTTVRMSTHNWKSGTGTRTFRKHKYMLNFRRMGASNKRFINLGILCEGLASFCQVSKSGENWTFADITARNVKDVFICEWNNTAGGLVVRGCEARPEDPDLDTRTAIGILVSGGDSKFYANRIINFRRSMVMHGTSYLIYGCHNFQGNVDQAGTRDAAYLHTVGPIFTTYVGNYVDNGGIEWTTENQSGYPPASFRMLTVVGNTFTMTGGATDTSYQIEITPCVDGVDLVGLSNITISGNSFRRFGGAALPRPENLRREHGDIDTTTLSNFTFDDNNFVLYDKKSTSRPLKIVQLAKADISNNWNFGDFTDLFPFGLPLRRVRSVQLGGTQGLFDSSDALIYPNCVTQISSGNLRARLSASAYGTIGIVGDCSA